MALPRKPISIVSAGYEYEEPTGNQRFFGASRTAQ